MEEHNKGTKDNRKSQYRQLSLIRAIACDGGRGVVVIPLLNYWVDWLNWKLWAKCPESILEPSCVCTYSCGPNDPHWRGKASTSCRECMKKGLGGNKTFRIASKSLIKLYHYKLASEQQNVPHFASTWSYSGSLQLKWREQWDGIKLSLHIWLLGTGLRGFWRVLLAGAVTVYRCAWLSVIECKWHLLCCPHPGKNQKEGIKRLYPPTHIGIQNTVFSGLLSP